VRSAAILLVVLATVRAYAHPLAPSVLELREQDDGRIAVSWKVPSARIPGTSATPILPASCRDVTPRERIDDAVGIQTHWLVECGSESVLGARVGVRDAGPTGTVVRVAFRDGRVVERLLLPSDAWLTIPPVVGTWSTMREYVRLGIAHILAGPDHLLFVFGLVLLAGTARRLLATVTAFTLGHSVTLAAAVLGLVVLPQAPIEIAIAASVFLLAVELARDPSRPTAMRRRPWTMAALFGLLHGLGFASALTAAGLRRADVPIALFAFNVGIEVGQLLFVALVLVVRALFAPIAARLPRWGLRIPVYAMGSLAAFWWIERTMALFR
jgi:hydrogenase/urease accessory protein HupE